MSLGATPPLQNATEEYNGSSWTNVTNNPTARRISQGAIGTQTAAIFVGNNSTISTQTELYDGTNWTEGATINTGRKYVAGFGIQTAATIVGGVAPIGTVT